MSRGRGCGPVVLAFGIGKQIDSNRRGILPSVHERGQFFDVRQKPIFEACPGRGLTVAHSVHPAEPPRTHIVATIALLAGATTLPHHVGDVIADHGLFSCRQGTANRNKKVGASSGSVISKSGKRSEVSCQLCHCGRAALGWVDYRLLRSVVSGCGN